METNSNEVVANIIEKSFQLVTLSKCHNEYFGTSTIHYGVSILKGLIIPDYYKIFNEIINMNKEVETEIRMSISIMDEYNPKMSFKTDLMKSNEISPDKLFDIIQLNDDNFAISDTTIITVHKTRMPLET